MAVPKQSGKPVIHARVTLDILIPNGVASEQEISDWLTFYLTNSGMLKNANPLADIEPEALPGSVKWEVIRAGVLLGAQQ